MKDKEYLVLKDGISQREGDVSVARPVGSVISVSAEAAASLIEAGLIEPVNKKASRRTLDEEA